MKIFGLDISLDHGGVVVLDGNGKVIDYGYLTTVKKMADVDSEHSILLSKKGKDESKDVFRLRRIDEYLRGLIHLGGRTKGFGAWYYSIEGYSYASQSTSMCQIAELTGYLKHMIFEAGGSIRIHDPLSVKLFATNKGNALKKDVVLQAQKHFNIPEGLIKKKQVVKKKKKGQNNEPWFATGNTGKIEEYDGPVTDIADAYFLARMVHTELKLRSGEVTLAQLKENERRIFLRVTKAYPVNLLDRSFICKEEG